MIADARRVWAALCSTGIEESVGKYFQLQQQEAAGHVRDLESALADIQVLEQQRGDLWRQAAHDLRGNLGVVANATVGLTHSGIRESTRDDFVRILMRNVTTLHHLLDDVTSLARLQAGREERRIEPLDVTPHRAAAVRGRPSVGAAAAPLPAMRRAAGLRRGRRVPSRSAASCKTWCSTPVKFTREGGITVSWGDSEANDSKRWALRVTDTGPGFHSPSAALLSPALSNTSDGAVAGAPPVTAAGIAPATMDQAGEGIGLSIVKRLCELLDATIEMTSAPNQGTSFRILFPRTYTH